MEEAHITIEANAEENEESFIRRLMKKGILVLKPSRSRQGVRYAEAEETWNVDLTDAKAVIKRLVERGFLKPEFVDRILTCPKCGSPVVYSKYACPKCGSHNVEFTELIEHKKCGNIGPKDGFAKGSSLICPRCQAELKEQMSDYRTIGNFYQCEKCGHRFDKPDVVHVCQNCEAISTYQDAKYVKVYAYKVNAEAIKDFQAELPILISVKKALLDEGFMVQLHAKVTGASGAQSPFDVLAEKDTARLVIDVSTTGNKNDIIALLAKKVDVHPTGTIVIDLSGLDEITNLGKVFGITVFKATQDQDLPEEFTSFLRLFSSIQGSGKPVRRKGG
jgi:rubrerythrin